MTQHEKMGEPVFAGGIWVWNSFLPLVDFTYETMEPALQVCAKHKVKTVMATMWGDDGQETVHSLALNQLPIFSEACWRPQDCSREIVKATGEFLTGLSRQAYEAFGLFHEGVVEKREGKAMIWCDLLYPLGPQGELLQDVTQRSAKALEMLAPYQEDLRCAYASAIFELIRYKGGIMQEIRQRYLAGDKNWLLKVAREDIPALVERYRKLRDVHRQVWEKEFKRNGWEVIVLRYGGAIGRLEDVAYALERYVAGELDHLCELEEDPLPTERKSGSMDYQVYVSPVFKL